MVCQHLFNCQMKKQQKIIYANVYRNTINDGDSQTSLLPIFCEGRGTSVHRLRWETILKSILGTIQWPNVIYTKIKFTKWIIEDKELTSHIPFKMEYLKLLQIALAYFLQEVKVHWENTNNQKPEEWVCNIYLYKSWTRNHRNRLSYNRLTLNSTHFLRDKCSSKGFPQVVRDFPKSFP